jgi:hypothetical protein
VSHPRKRIRESAHGREESDDFLDVMRYIFRFLKHFGHQVNCAWVLFRKPGMSYVQLVAQDEPKRFILFRHDLCFFGTYRCNTSLHPTPFPTFSSK